MKDKKTIRSIEIIFDMAYLLTVLVLGILLLCLAKSKPQFLHGIMALVLVFGDSFHLIPRIASIKSTFPKRFTHMLGIGKMVASITMTLFYVLLWHIGMLLFSIPNAQNLTLLVYIFAAARILLCLLPKNKWSEENPPYRWGIYRNIPFILLGVMTGLLFFFNQWVLTPALKWMWIAILISFLCYLPVVLGAHKYPRLGMLMLPKSCIYIWIVAMGL